jgi:DNA topoisomerase-1
MGNKKLVVVESPAKAKTINKILGKDYIVKSSMGHIRDLPVKRLGVNVEKNFEPDYVLVKGRRTVISELKAAAKECDEIYLAPDPDREGEAIAWHLREILDDGKKAFHRIQYNEITPRAVRAAFDHPGELDMDRVNAQQARRILDRIVGYRVSPLLWRRVKRGLSAGRVQSVALRLVCEREDAIDAFKPEPYWVMGAVARKLLAPLDPFSIKLTRINGAKAEVHDETLAAEVATDLEGCKLRVKEMKTRIVSRKPHAPFITSTLQQAGSTFLGFSPKRTMALAQQLYEGVNLGQGPEGLITYMRTDSFNISADATAACSAHVEKAYGSEYLPEKPNVYRSRSGAQEAHEAIRPTDVTRTPAKIKQYLDAPAYKLYTLIWERFVASQMVPAKLEMRTVYIEPQVPAEGTEPMKHSYLFQATVTEVAFAGYRKVLGENDKKKADSDQVDILPALKEGEPLVCLELLSERKETQPPARFSEASLIKALEANGVGRPSTYQQTVSTLQQRTYVNVEKRSLHPTDLGRQTCSLLVESLPKLFDVGFTAGMEEQLDEVEAGHLEWTKLLGEFYEKFADWMEKTKGPAADPERVRAFLGGFVEVTEWAPEVKRGRRTYSDEKFVTSIGETLESDKPELSMRQFEALAKIAARYRDQVPSFKGLLTDYGFENMLSDPTASEPDTVALRKVELLDAVEMDEGGRKFADSLAAQVRSGRALSERQAAALDRMVVANGKQIPDFETVRTELGLTEAEVPEDHESGPLLEGMKSVVEWKAPVKRGKREFNDQTFYESLSSQFGQRGHLSERQRGALKRLVKRYHEQVTGYEELAARFELDKGGRKGAKAAEKSED